MKYSFFKTILIIGGLLAIPGCQSEIAANFTISGINLSLDGSELGLPPEVQGFDDGGEVIRLDCGQEITDEQCTQLNERQAGSCEEARRFAACDFDESIVVECVEDNEGPYCEPQPYYFEYLDAPEVDLRDESSSVKRFEDVIEEISILAMRYDVTENNLNTEIPEIHLFWAPSQAASNEIPRPNGELAPSGASYLGSIGPIGANDTSDGEARLNQEGLNSLNDYLTNTGFTVKFVASTEVDFDVGDPIPNPNGDLGVEFSIDVRVVALEIN